MEVEHCAEPGRRRRPAREAWGGRGARYGRDGQRGRTRRYAGTLYQLKAEFFKTLGHPTRIRVLELLSEREHAVAEMLAEVGIEAASLSQQLAVLRKANLVLTRREGSNVYYRLASPDLAELLRVARGILSGVLQGQAQLLADLHATRPR